jgi:hypothetical protein
VKNLLICFLTLSYVNNVWSLAIDEKLPLRILSLSKSKKTMLINRGLEDGLEIGNHAKFYVTEGVIARGVVVKASPTRTIWSLYRLVEPSNVEVDKVLNLKIATPVKLTGDVSKMVTPGGEIPNPNNSRLVYSSDAAENFNGKVETQYPLEDVDVLTEEGIGVDRDLDLETLEKETADQLPKQREQSLATNYPVPVSTNFSGWDIAASLAMNSLSSDVSSDNEAYEDFSGSLSVFDLTLGVYKLFPNGDFLRHMAFGFYIHKSSQTTASIRGGEATSDIFMYGPEIIYSFSDPFSIDQFQFYTTLAYALGSADDTYTQNLDSTNSQEVTNSGDATALTLGLGTKFFTRRGWGFKTQLDYYSRTEDYSDDTTAYQKSVSGPRISFGLYYRF